MKSLIKASVVVISIAASLSIADCAKSQQNKTDSQSTIQTNGDTIDITIINNNPTPVESSYSQPDYQTARAIADSNYRFLRNSTYHYVCSMRTGGMKHNMLVDLGVKHYVGLAMELGLSFDGDTLARMGYEEVDRDLRQIYGGRGCY